MSIVWDSNWVYIMISVPNHALRTRVLTDNGMYVTTLHFYIFIYIQCVK